MWYDTDHRFLKAGAIEMVIRKYVSFHNLQHRMQDIQVSQRRYTDPNDESGAIKAAAAAAAEAAANAANAAAATVADTPRNAAAAAGAFAGAVKDMPRAAGVARGMTGVPRTIQRQISRSAEKTNSCLDGRCWDERTSRGGLTPDELTDIMCR